jgi:N-acyl-D-aspartate/D-glutamate deacylase
MRAGAIGFSSSRTRTHNTAKGEPIPSLRATEEELTAIAMGLADAGSGVLELVSDFSFPRYSEQIQMFRRIMANSGRPLSLSLAQAQRSPEHYKRMLNDLADANRDGLKFTGQIAPRGMGFLYGLQSSAHPFVFYPSFAAIENKPLEEKLRIMRDPSFRARLLAESGEKPTRLSVMPDYDRVFRVGNPMNFEPDEKDSVQAQAAALGRDPADLMYDWLLEDEGRNFFFAPFNNYVYCNLDACRDMIAHPNTVIGLGDGGAHVGYISDGSFPTTLLAHWGRDRKQGRFDLGFLVKRQTMDTARTVGLNDRGVLAAGFKGDINVIDLDKLAVERPRMAFDLPAGGKRLLQKARGYDATIVSGNVIYRHGEDTGARPGRLVRMRPQG